MSERTTCLIAGGGPAGMVLGLLLARAGVAVTVLEKHDDFLRDFRGDTVHPSTIRLLDELGLGERFAALPQTLLDHVAFPIGGKRVVTMADFRRLPRPYRHIAMVPQWDLLTLLAEAGREEPSFTLRMGTEVTGLLRENGRVTGVRHRGPDGEGEIRAALTVGCDGRWSLVRREAELVPREFPVGIDAWWFRLTAATGLEMALTPRGGRGRFLVVIPREDYLQIAYIGRKGSDAELRARGVEAFRADIAELVPELGDGVNALESMDDVKHLDIRLDRLRRWHGAGVLCIGDAAHAMSPMGGVGINLAVQDAVAAATLLAEPLRAGAVGDRDLARVRARRLLPTAVVQRLQRTMEKVMAEPMLQGRRVGPPATLVALMEHLPFLSAVPARLIGLGLRSEHAPEFARRRPAPPGPVG
ncbi:FAD-dependent oxidoreductase [Nocardiopsis sp. N85]|uniref:FAD-dependent oxidoreductase n=1 Tax=Nocardiopsis sp. N85 TaxID=3029400 RepID=UPI00237F700F|nr:FAD-dependent oxidoreductase [Nocardiopsis sp. N85]MDE3720400.1 FAD-dependent oxidoreductase [Nocardiopsis sp. N85]